MGRSSNRSSSRPATSSRPQQPAKQPQRQHSTAAAVPVAKQAPPVITQQNGGILSNILQTAAGVAVGHTVGRMITGVFGGSSNAPIEAAEPASPALSDASYSSFSSFNRDAPVQCQADTKRFLDCMSQNHDDIAACQMYLELMRQCQRQFA